MITMKRSISTLLAIAATTISIGCAQPTTPASHSNLDCYRQELRERERLALLDNAVACLPEPIHPPTSFRNSKLVWQREYYYRMIAGLNLVEKGDYHNALVNFHIAYKVNREDKSKARRGALAARSLMLNSHFNDAEKRYTWAYITGNR